MLEQDAFNLSLMNDVELVDEYIKIQDELNNAKKKKFALEQRAKLLMEERGSSIIQGDAKELILDSKPIYDKSRLKPLKEILSTEDLIRRKALIPEQTIIKEEDWNMTNLKPFMKYGEEVKNYVEKSIIGQKQRFILKQRR